MAARKTYTVIEVSQRTYAELRDRILQSEKARDMITEEGELVFDNVMVLPEDGTAMELMRQSSRSGAVDRLNQGLLSLDDLKDVVRRHSLGLYAALKDVEDFATGAGHYLPPAPDMSSFEKLKLCERLIDEEVLQELLPALRRRDPVKTVDGIVDGIYVLLFTALMLGLPVGEVWLLVQAANMSKRFPDGTFHRDVGNKVIKPPGWESPDKKIEELIQNGIRRHG